jgi:rod shape-determining protein MreD
VVFLIFGYLLLGVQAGVGGPFLRVGGGVPDVVLVGVIFVAGNARREEGLVGCVVMGLMQDLLTSQALGVYGLAYGIVGLFVIQMREFVEREHALTYFFMGLMGGLITGGVVFVHGWVRGPGVSVEAVMMSAVYTAVIGVVVLEGLQRIKGIFGFRASMRRH